MTNPTGSITPEQARRNSDDQDDLVASWGTLRTQWLVELSGTSLEQVRQWQSDRSVFSVLYRGIELFPRFQFDDSWQALHALPVAMHGWELAEWWVSPLDVLDWEAPAQVILVDAPHVIAAALLEAREWANAGAPGYPVKSVGRFACDDAHIGW